MRWLIGGAVVMVAFSLGSAGQARQVSAESGQFRTVQVSTANVEKFLAEWAKPSEPARLETQSSARRGETLHTFIVFGGCKADAAGDCQVTVDYQILKPDGAVYADQKNVPIYKGKAPPTSTFFLSDSSLGLRFEPQDALGAYTVKAAVTDHVAKLTLSTQQVLTATD